MKNLPKNISAMVPINLQTIGPDTKQNVLAVIVRLHNVILHTVIIELGNFFQTEELSYVSRHVLKWKRR